jgi:hypothetical protein
MNIPPISLAAKFAELKEQDARIAEAAERLLKFVMDGPLGAPPLHIDKGLVRHGEDRPLVGDYYTHDRTGVRFVCRSVTRHDYSGALPGLKVELEPVQAIELAKGKT